MDFSVLMRQILRFYYVSYRKSIFIGEEIIKNYVL